MTGISASAINTNQREISNTSLVPKKAEKDQSNQIEDKVEIKSGLNKVAKFALGVGTAAIVAPIKGLSRGLEGATKAGLKGAGFEDDKLPDGMGSKLEWVTIGLLAPIGGAAIGVPLGVPGMLLGAVVAPGVAGGLIETGKGAVEGFSKGFKLAGELAVKADEKVTDRLGRTAGVAAGMATVFTASVLAPVGAIFGAIDKGMNFAEKAIGVKDESGYKKLTLGNFSKDVAVTGSYLLGTFNAPGFFTAFPIGAALAGGVATTVSAVKEGANGLVDGVKDSMKFAEFMVG